MNRVLAGLAAPAALALVLLIAIATGVPAQSSIDLSDFRDSLESFSDEVSTVLPVNSLVGLNWSDAYIGQFFRVPPNVGAGLTVGATLIPMDAIDALVAPNTFSGLVDQEWYAVADRWGGFPMPAFALDARVGGVWLPFDLGVKVGGVNGFALGENESGPTLDYLLGGTDVRVALLPGGILLPRISVGVAANFLSGRFSSGEAMDTLTVTSILHNDEKYDVEMTDPELFFEWGATTLDVKAQISKSLVIVTPHLGMGVTIASSTVTTGFRASPAVTGGSGSPPSLSDLAAANGLSLDAEGFRVQVESRDTVHTRLFGGLSLNLFILKIDASVMLDLDTDSVGATIGARIQL